MIGLLSCKGTGLFVDQFRLSAVAPETMFVTAPFLTGYKANLLTTMVLLDSLLNGRCLTEIRSMLDRVESFAEVGGEQLPLSELIIFDGKAPVKLNRVGGRRLRYEIDRDRIRPSLLLHPARPVGSLAVVAPTLALGVIEHVVVDPLGNGGHARSTGTGDLASKSFAESSGVNLGEVEVPLFVREECSGRVSADPRPTGQERPR